MRVTGALPWWGERPEDLAACIHGLGNVVDRVVALDGAYVRYPKATARSSKAQVDAIIKAAADVDIECLVLQPNKLWAGQVEKRCHLLAAACVQSDWVVTVDADHIISTDRDRARHNIARLGRAGADVIAVPYYTPLNPNRSVKDSSPGKWHEEQAGQRVLVPHIYRALPGMRIEKRHWWYSAVKDGERVWLWSSDEESYPYVRQFNITIPYEVEHRALMRTPEQIRLSRAFLNDREMIMAKTGQEDDVPGLPAPKFDYESIPR